MIINVSDVQGTRSKEQLARSQANLVGFFDYTQTFSNASRTVTCCGLDGSAVTASCGLGHGCEAACFALDRSLCPSGDCQDCYDLTADSSRSCTAFSNSADCNRCAFDGCKVAETPGCCFVEECCDKRPCKCKWMEHYLGR